MTLPAPFDPVGDLAQIADRQPSRNAGGKGGRGGFGVRLSATSPLCSYAKRV